MALTLYLLRHGQTPSSRDNQFCGTGTDAELTEDGKAMAASFAEAYKSVAWQAVYCSPLKRTMATAEPLCHLAGLKPEIREELKEINYGKWEGLTTEIVSLDFHDDYVSWSADPAWYPPTGGETAVAIERRVLKIIEEISQRFTDGNVLIVSHKATIRIILCALLGIDVGRFRFRLACPVGSVSVIEFKAQGPSLNLLADRSHQSEYLRSLPGT